MNYIQNKKKYSQLLTLHKETDKYIDFKEKKSFIEILLKRIHESFFNNLAFPILCQENWSKNMIMRNARSTFYMNAKTLWMYFVIGLSLSLSVCRHHGFRAIIHYNLQYIKIMI